MKLYTRGGDRGDTGLVGGRRVPKEDLRVEAYGALDELVSWLGVVQSELPPALEPVGELIERLQHELFILSAELATPAGHAPPAHVLGPRHVQRLEQEIDAFTEGVEDVHAFVLPRGVPVAARLQVARTVARRAERAVVRLHRNEPQRPEVLAYLNRLSGLLFALALSVNRQSGFREVAPDYTR